jgi:hypothetical protein
MSLLLVGAGVVVVLLFLKNKQQKKQIQEAKTKENDLCLKDSDIVLEDGGMQGDDYHTESISPTLMQSKEGSIGASSTAAFLSEDVRSMPSAKETKEEKRLGERQEQEERRKREETEKEETGRIEKDRESTTISLTYIVSGISSQTPFERQLVDVRDSILNTVRSTHCPTPSLDERILKGKETILHLINGCGHLLRTKEEETEKILMCFSAVTVVESAEHFLVFTSHPSLLREDAGTLTLTPQLYRWKAPEILTKRLKREDEKSCIFTIASILYLIVSLKIPLHEISDEGASASIIQGFRPNLVKLFEEEKEFTNVIERCWCPDSSERLSFDRLKKKIEENIRDEEKDDDNDDDDSEVDGLFV